jgi:hypothetical protein
MLIIYACAIGPVKTGFTICTGGCFTPTGEQESLISTDLIDLDLLGGSDVCSRLTIDRKNIGVIRIAGITLMGILISAPIILSEVKGGILKKVDGGRNIADLKLQIVIIDGTVSILLDHSYTTIIDVLRRSQIELLRSEVSADQIASYTHAHLLKGSGAFALNHSSLLDIYITGSHSRLPGKKVGGAFMLQSI